jgi:transposase InsO family protein
LNFPRRRPRRRRSGSDIRLPGAVRPKAVWSYDFVHDQIVDGRCLKMLCVIDEYAREYLAIEVGASLRAQDVILTLSRLMRLYGKPAHVRSDNGAEFTAARSSVLADLLMSDVSVARIRSELGIWHARIHRIIGGISTELIRALRGESAWSEQLMVGFRAS